MSNLMRASVKPQVWVKLVMCLHACRMGDLAVFCCVCTLVRCRAAPQRQGTVSTALVGSAVHVLFTLSRVSKFVVWIRSAEFVYLSLTLAGATNTQQHFRRIRLFVFSLKLYHTTWVKYVAPVKPQGGITTCT